MIKLYATVLVVVLSLSISACGIIPEGEYVLPAGSSLKIYNEQGTPQYQVYVGHRPGADPTPTPESTFIPITPIPRYCAAKIGAVRQNVRADHFDTATVIGKIEVGGWMRVEKLFIYSDITNEWAYGSAKDANSGNTLTGWIKLGTNAVLEDSKECWEVKKEYPTATPTPQPTSTPGFPVGCALRANSNVNIRTSPTGSVFRVVLTGTELTAEARYQGATYLWYKVWVPEDFRYGWSADFYTELTDACGRLPFISPF